MKHTLGFFTLTVLLLAAGCATPVAPPAVQTEYAVVEMGPDSFMIYYQGEQAASRERIVDFGMLRACHLARERGYKYFAIVDLERSGTDGTYFGSGELEQDLRHGLVIHGFTSRPADVFVFKASSLETLIHRKYRAGGYDQAPL